MKKQLLVPSLVLVGLLVGCTTQMVDSAGNPVPGPDGKPFMVSCSTKEQVEKCTVQVREIMRSKSQELLNPSNSLTLASVEKAPDLSGVEIRRLIGYEATEEAIAALKAIAVAEYRRFLLEVVYPARAKAQIERIRPLVDELIAEGNYAKAREVLWRAPTSGIPEIDAPVRAYAVERMHVEVNPAEWALIEKEILDKVAEFVKQNKYDEAIAWLKAFRRVRTFSMLLDDKLKAVEAELVKIGVSADNMKPILDATGKLVGEAERILDMTDVTTNTVTTTEGREIAGSSPDLKAYEERLEEYRKTLLRYDCTETAAQGIVGKFDGDVKPLLASLCKPSSKEDDKTETKSFLQLGTAALNARIDKLTAKCLEDLAKQKAAYLAKVREAAIKAAIDDMTAKVKQLVKEGKFAEAREVIWKATSTEDLDKNARLRVVGVELLLKLVNPSHWGAIEKEFAAKVKEAKDGASYDEAIEWVNSYPDIRTYTELIDTKLDMVKEELVKIGIKAENVQPVVDETQKATVEAARLASHVDTVDKIVEDGVKLPLDDYQKLLADYRTALVRNDCTEANADKLVEDFKNKIAPQIAILTGGKTKDVLMLGSNAINDRLAKLRAKTVESLKSMKYKYVFTDLIAKVSEAVTDARYGDARNIIRDVALVKDVDWDARIYATRIGLLNSVVNPNQCAALLKEIDAKAKELFDAQKYEEFREYAENYEYVHDTYQQIVDALEQLKAAMIGLTIAQKDAEKYIDNLSARIRALLEKRTGAYAAEVDKDLTELEKALAELEKGIVAQYYKPEEVAKFCKVVKAEILALITKAPDPMTTWELNEMLRARLAKYTAQLDDLIAKRDAANEAKRYAKLLEDIDAEVSFESQIAMAEDAIAKQLGIECPEAHLQLNELLGEYVRTMRLLKLGKKIDAAQATVALLGGVYLDQSAVVTRALELGADVNGTSSRDPLARTGVLLAIQTGHNAFLKSLADAKASLSPVDTNGDTALHYAVRRGNLAVVKAMLKMNGVDKTNKVGETALFIAVRRNQASVAAALVAAKADVTVKNAEGQTAMDAACLAGSRDVLDVLANAGAEYGPKQLIIAAAKDRLAVAQWLVGNGVDVNAPEVMHSTVAKSDTYRYLLHEGGVFKPCGQPDCKRCLIEKGKKILAEMVK